jgi:hypothetical protein
MSSRMVSGSVVGLLLVLAISLSTDVALAQRAIERDLEPPADTADTSERVIQHIAVGDRLRVSYLSALGPKRTSGTLTGWDLDSLRLRISGKYSETIAWSEVNRVEQSISRKRATKTGAIIGAVIGLAGGVAFGIALANDEFLGSSGSDAGAIVALGAAGAFGGLLIGSGIGALIVSDDWAPVPVEDARTATP